MADDTRDAADKAAAATAKAARAGASVAKTGADAGAAIGRSAADAAARFGETAAGTVGTMAEAASGATGSMAQTASEAARNITQTASSAAQDMGRTAMGAMPHAGNFGVAMGAGMPGMAEFSKLFSSMKNPAMPDMEALLSAHRRNLETLTAANRIALEGAQAVARRHMEIVQQNMSELTEGMRQMTSPEAPQAKAARQAEMLKASYERAVANMHELSDLIQRSNGEALTLLHRRFGEAMDEVKSLAEKTGKLQA